MAIRNTRRPPPAAPRRKMRRGLPGGPANDDTRVGVRELRQNLSVYLDRVKLGETLTVTEHGAVVAVLGPPRRDSASPLERLVADGRAVPPRHGLGALRAPRPAPLPGAPSEAVIRDLRDERVP